jgi:flagellar biosynthesis GTPase FlhF
LDANVTSKVDFESIKELKEEQPRIKEQIKQNELILVRNRGLNRYDVEVLNEINNCINQLNSMSTVYGDLLKKCNGNINSLDPIVPGDFLIILF